MAEDLLEKLKRTDLAILTELVRQDQCSSDFAILDWTVESLSKKGFGGSEGLFLSTVKAVWEKQKSPGHWC